MKKIILLLICIVFSSATKAEQYSMRDCILLPISDTAGNSFGFKVYENLERYIKNAEWCNYESSSEVISIFSKYRDKLPVYLQDDKVLKTVADRLQVGTLIRVQLEYGVDNITVNLDVIGENGADTYLSEKAVINKIDEDLVVTTIRNWLETYRATIPYDGKVVGILGDQITFQFSKDNQIGIGQDFKISRLLRKKKHPLLKKVVEWDTVKIANGKVYSLSRGQALGIIKVYTSEKKIQVGDWLKLEKVVKKENLTNRRFTEEDEYKYGKLGDLSLSFILSSHNVSTSSVNGNNKLGGFIYGVSAEAEAWLTRNYFAMGEYSIKTGNLSKVSGSPDSDTSGQNASVFKIAGGYKHLPLGFFYGPQINAYAGWANYSYDMDDSDDDGFGTNSISGIILGLGGSVPLKKDIRIYGSGEMMPFPEFDDDSNTFGSVKNVSSITFEAGVQYQWSSKIRLMGAFESISNKVKFSGSNSDLTYRDTEFKVGGVFTF